MVSLKKLSHYIVLAILLLVAGLTLALPNQAKQKHADEQYLRDEIAIAAVQSGETVKYEPRSVREFNLNGNLAFKKIKPILEDQGFYLLTETISGSPFTAKHRCEDNGSGLAVYQKSESEYLAISYKHKKSLVGCKPIVAKAMFAQVSKK